MLVMGLDTALQRCSVAILRDGEVLADEMREMERGHAEQLAPMAASALAKAGVAIREFDRIGVVVGPGGFTGVRVALSFARGLGIGRGLKIVGVTSLAALAAGVGGSGLTAAVINARRDQVYAALYGSNGEIILPPFVAEPKEALQLLVDAGGDAPVTLVGSGVGLLEGLPDNWQLGDASAEIDAKIVAQIAARAPVPEAPPAPLYLRGPDAKPGKPGIFSALPPE